MLFVIAFVPSSHVVLMECSGSCLADIAQERVSNNMHHPKVALPSGLLVTLLAALLFRTAGAELLLPSSVPGTLSLLPTRVEMTNCTR